MELKNLFFKFKNVANNWSDSMIEISSIFDFVIKFFSAFNFLKEFDKWTNCKISICFMNKGCIIDSNNNWKINRSFKNSFFFNNWNIHRSTKFLNFQICWFKVVLKFQRFSSFWFNSTELSTHNFEWNSLTLSLLFFVTSWIGAKGWFDINR